MSEAQPIRIPTEFVNDESVKLLRWLVEEGQEIQEGDTVAEIETSKAVVELGATAAGRVWLRREVGEEIRVGEIVGYISKNGDAPPAVGVFARTGTEDRGAQPAIQELPGNTRFSKKALAVLNENGLAPALFAGRGLVREEHVLEHLKVAKRPQPLSGDFDLDKIALDRVSLPSTFHDRESGKLEQEFLARLKSDPDAIAKLSSEDKCETYRKHGAVIGQGVSLGAGTILVAAQLVVGDGVQLGDNSSIACRGRFLIGQLSSFRSNLSVRGGTVVIGENIFAGKNIEIGGGGNGDPHSLLCIGDDTYIGDDVFINICRPVLIGKEVFLTQRSILVTHNVGHSVLEGYENRFSPIVLEDRSQVGMNSTIYAGSRIGSGAIVMSNSYVISSIPAGKLAGGVPARVIREATRQLDRKKQIELVFAMMSEYREMLERKGHQVSPWQSGLFPAFEMQSDGKLFRLEFRENASEASAEASSADECVVWTLDNSMKRQQPSGVVIDLLAKTIVGSGGVFLESTREFLRKRGIRLQPGPWKYRGGFI